MAALKKLYGELTERLENGEIVAVASIARLLGSGPRSQGTRCAILADGTILGTIGGGLMEARTREEGITAIREGKIRYLKIRMDSKELAANGMICGGSADILVAPWTKEEAPVARELLLAFTENRQATLFTSWEETGSPVNVGVLSKGRWCGSSPMAEGAPGLSEKAFAAGKPILEGTPVGPATLAEPIEREKSPLVILGGGHVGKALVEVAAFAGFSVNLVDDREEFADPAKHPRAERVLCREFEGALRDLGVDETTFIVICTRGHLSDTVCLSEAMAGPSPYVGLIGSKRKRGMVVKHILSSGVSEGRLAAMRSPVGLEIGSETPEEIAVSIVAQMIAVKRGVPTP